MRYRGEEAIGLIETIGMVPAIYAADAMLKAGDTELVSYENVGSTLVTILVQGDVAACEAAVKAGVKAVEELGAEVYSSVVIPRPHPSLKKITEKYTVEKLLPY